MTHTTEQERVDTTVFKRLLNDYADCLRNGDFQDAGAALLAVVAEYQQAARRCAPQWKVVPVEPTEKMINEGSCAQTLKDGHQYIGGCAAKTAWTFMLAAAPKPSRKTNP